MISSTDETNQPFLIDEIWKQRKTSIKFFNAFKILMSLRAWHQKNALSGQEIRPP